MNVFFDIAANILNLDVAFISEMVVRQGISAFMDIPAKWNCIDANVNVSDTNDADYFEAGYCFGEIIKMLYDLNINN